MADAASTWHGGQRQRPQGHPGNSTRQDHRIPHPHPNPNPVPSTSFARHRTLPQFSTANRSNNPAYTRPLPKSHPAPHASFQQDLPTSAVLNPEQQQHRRRDISPSTSDEIPKTPPRARACEVGSVASLIPAPSYFPRQEGQKPRPDLRHPQADYDQSDPYNEVNLPHYPVKFSTELIPNEDKVVSFLSNPEQSEPLRNFIEITDRLPCQGKAEAPGGREREGTTGEGRLPITMNIDVVGRMRQMTRAEGAATKLLVEANSRVAAQAGGPYFGFQTLHSSNTNTYDVFRLSVETLLDLHLAGYNVCLMIGGESGSGKSYNMTGESSNRAGLVQMVVDHLFAKLSEERYQPQTRMSKQDPKVTMEMVEVYNEMIKDLLCAPHGTNLGYLDITETAERGVHAKSATVLEVRDASTANTQFRNGWGRRTESITDRGPASQNAAVILHIDLSVKVGDNPQPYKSRFTIVELPGLEKLSANPTEVQLREGPQLSKALVALNQVTNTLANNPFPDRVVHYGDSKLTQLLQEELGGNFKTRALICLKPKSDVDVSNAILKFCTNLSHIRNFPIVNDGFAQGLLIQKEARIQELKFQSGTGPVHMTSHTAPVYGDSGEEIRRLQTENLEAYVKYDEKADKETRRLQTENLVLKDQTERLQLRLDRLQNKFGDAANNRTDLSQQLLLSEEEKLKVSQSLVDMQIENNKIREEAEAAKFELTNKIILLENQVMENEAEADKHKKGSVYAKERLTEVEKDRKDLADEYVVLKTNYLALTKEHQKELARNEELAVELLNLVNSKATLMRQVAILTNSDPNDSDASIEVDRVRALVAKNSGGKVKANEILGTQRDREQVEQTLFASKKKYDSEVGRLKRELEDENKKLENRMTSVMKELTEARNLARERQQKISELNAKVITLRGDKASLETQLNRLQHKVKDLGEDFRARLVKYVEDIAEFVEKGGAGRQSEGKLREYCDSMMRDIRRSHKEREGQLSEAARTFRERMGKTVASYEALLIAYRNLRQTCEARGFQKEDLGPDEYELKLTDSELQTANLKEIDRLKSELSRSKNETDALKMRYGLFGEDKDTMAEITVAGKSDMWGAMRKQMREFTLNTQQQLEQERARLLSENHVLKEQVAESQQYIDSHLARYKQEIVRLRKICGINEDGVIVTDRAGRLLPKTTFRR